LNVPVEANVRVYGDCAGERSPETVPSSNVTLCVDEPGAHVHVTVVPADTTMFGGAKLSSET
jgi:hypothetical protein